MPSIDRELNTSRDFRDISLTFARHPVTNDIGVFVNENAIKRSVQNLCRTKLGERFYNPILGSNIDNSMFEPAGPDIALELEDDIELLLENFEPRVRQVKVRVSYPVDTNELVVEISYDIVGIVAPRQNVDFILQSTRI
jgi:phage baseplate assembly protein W|tara:strand:+ start:2389 stop:2805 length:417 start_codon:yes stop_codon:yes gene_type:complete